MGSRLIERKPPKTWRRAAFIALTCSWLLGPFSPASAAESSLWLREPAISPDGSKIAFRFEGQIWIAPTKGGGASPLTPSGFHAASPVWSPSGETIAFAADRFGPMNVFVAPVRGGEAKRLTWYGADERPSSFTPDGKAVLFASHRLGDAAQTFAIPGSSLDWQLYEVPLAEGRDRLTLPNAAFDARWDREKRWLLYTSASIEQPYRRGQTSSAARQVWLYDAQSGRHQRLTDDVHESRDAVWSATGAIYYLSEASGSLNVWKMPLADRKPFQITHFSGDPVGSLSISRGDDLAFSRSGELYLLRNGATAPERIEINVAQAAFDGERAARTGSIDDFALSPTGKEIAVTARGDIYVVSMNGRYVKRVTATPGEERWPTFSPDGRTLTYAGERDGHWSLYQSRIADPDEKTFSEATVLNETLLKAGDQDAMFPTSSPDGRHIAYVDNRESVRVVGSDGKGDVEILPKGQNYSYTDYSWWLSWSPDSKWIALPVQPSEAVSNVAVAPADGGRPALRISPAGEWQFSATWSNDGGFLIWRDVADALASALGSVENVDAEAVHASRKARDAFQAKLREPVVGEATSAPDAPASPDAKEANGEVVKAARPAGKEMFAFEPDGVEDRKIRLSQGPTQLEYVGFLADGVSVLLVERTANSQGAGLSLTGTAFDMRQQRRRTLFSGLAYQSGPVTMSRDQKKLYFLSKSAEGNSDGITEVDLAKGTSRTIRFDLDVTHDDAEVRAAAFEQFWDLTKKKFFDPELNGVDWEAARIKYERFLPSVVDPKDLSELLSEMLGELRASHSWSGYHSAIPRAEQTASLGLYYDERYPGPGMKVTEILTNGPFDVAETALKPGDILQQIDGEDIPAEGGVGKALRGRADQLMAITIEHPDGSRFTEKRVPVNLSRETTLARARWIRRKRDEVVSKSCGHLGYVYVEGMNARSYREVFSEIFGRFGNADGLVVDVRYNGGGRLTNQLLTLLSGKPYLTYAPPRGAPEQQEPRGRWTKPSAVVMNAASYSDASMFPHAYQDFKLGPLVGDPVAGTGTSVWWAESNLIPGLSYGIPQVPIRDRDGKLYENAEIFPDIAVPSNPTAWEKGEDPQLDAAIAALMPKNAVCTAVR